MTAILISYDLIAPGQKYAALHERIKAYGTYAHVLESTWIVVKSGITAQGVYSDLKSVLDDGDNIFAVDVTGASRQGWLPKSTWDWIGKNV